MTPQTMSSHGRGIHLAVASLLYLSTLVVTGVMSQPQLHYPCPHPPGSELPASAQMLAKIPDQFEVHVEANIMQKQQTAEAVELYDFPNKRAAMSITRENQTVTSIFSYATGERFDILPDGTCNTLNLSDSAFDVFGFTEMRGSGPPTMRSAGEVFRFSNEFPKVFIGEKVVRGISVYHWQSCQTWNSGGLSKAAYTLDFYVSKPGYTTATSDSSIPIRAVINGVAINVDGEGKPIGGTHNFSHIYDFSFFRAGPIADESLFEIPRGTVCNRKEDKTLPQLPDQFSLSMEVYVAGTERPPMTERMLFDYDFGLIQTDRFAPRGTGERFGLTKLTIVEDYKNHVQYVIDSFDGNCTISHLPEGLSTSDGGEGDKITMKHGQQLLRYGNRKFKYQGQRTLRDMKVNVWAEKTADGMVQEVYFLAGWPNAMLRTKLMMMNLDLDLSRMNILVGTYLLNTTAIKSGVGPLFQLFGNKPLRQWGDKWQGGAAFPQSGGNGGTGGVGDASIPRPGDLLRARMPRKQVRWDSARMRFPDASEKMINIFNYVPMHMDMSAFDVSQCYKKNAQEMFVYFMLEGTYASVVSNQRYVFLSSTKSAVAKAAGISMLRITKVNVWQDLVSNRLNLFFSLLEPPPVSGVPSQLSCRDAFKNLAKAVQDGMTITIKHPLRTEQLHVVTNSLKSWSSLEDLWNKVMPGARARAKAVQKNMAAAAAGVKTEAPENHVSVQQVGYTTGQFGGMAFGMLVLGMLVGVVGMYVALRRLRPDIHLLPYQQSK